MPGPVRAHNRIAQRLKARVQIGLFVRPIGFRFRDGVADRDQVESVDRVIVLLHAAQLVRQLALEVGPMGGVFLRGLRFGAGGFAQTLLFEQQRFGAGAVLPPVGFFQTTQFVHLALGRGEFALRI